MCKQGREKMGRIGARTKDALEASLELGAELHAFSNSLERRYPGLSEEARKKMNVVLDRRNIATGSVPVSEVGLLIASYLEVTSEALGLWIDMNKAMNEKSKEELESRRATMRLKNEVDRTARGMKEAFKREGDEPEKRKNEITEFYRDYPLGKALAMLAMTSAVMLNIFVEGITEILSRPE